ncbi:DUF3149 domain-containing protein [Rhodoferax lacus]|uniref:DUF3149 domain-containing protein n=1 Tax=Rhodoferax lacus TaxID=2184758 RepID=A0A3E1RCS6_9BURK|nr:DUF3149 domain-containing protein [Rhodoferax lacus]RFO96430.1 DUF3149 domain-containing protein [Rhodoferax lacus]
MKLLTDLFTTDYGIMSISGIAFMLGMAVFFYWYINRKMDEAEALASKKKIVPSQGSKRLPELLMR